jgi:hypothetical protein
MVSASSNPHEQKYSGSKIFNCNHGVSFQLILLPCSIAVVHEKQALNQLSLLSLSLSQAKIPIIITSPPPPEENRQ